MVLVIAIQPVCSIILSLVILTNGVLALQSELPGVSAANNAFAFDLFKKITTTGEDKNIFLSPYSISTALTMTYAGARGNTAEEMAAVLHYAASGEDVHKAFQILTRDVEWSSKEGCQLNVANALWGQEGYGFRKAFLDLVARYYYGGFNEVDFRNETEKSRKTINDWVMKNTAGKIKELVARGDIGGYTRLVLTNAIYFKGDWASQFKKDSTKKRPFYVGPEKVVDVQMMFKADEFRYYAPSTKPEKPVDSKVVRIGRPVVQNQGIQILELPYKGDDLSKVILLSSDGLESIEASIGSETLNDWFSRLGQRDVEVYLPKFKFQSKYYLKDTLEAMGMRDAFDERRADFSGMTVKKDLCISQVFHQADIEVNEEGTEAAAATVVGMRKRVSCAPEMPVVIFEVDHPFIFLIRHRPTNAILFIGRVMNPNEAK